MTLSPERVFDPGHELPVPYKFFSRRSMRSRCTPRPFRGFAHGDQILCGNWIDRFGRKFQSNLTPTFQFDIDLREQLGIEQGTVLHAVAAVDAIAGAECIERKLGSGMAFFGQGYGIDHPGHADWLAFAERQFGVEKPEIEPGVVRDERSIPDKFEELMEDVPEQRLVCKKCARKAMHSLCACGHIPFRIVIGVIGFSGGDEIEQLHAADFHHPIARLRVESGGFGVENDFTHRLIYRTRGRRLQEPFASYLPAQQIDKSNDLALGFRQRLAGIDDVVGTLALFGVRHLE